MTHQPTSKLFLSLLAAAALSLSAVIPTPALAHCDALDGPVVVEARGALEDGDIDPLLKWIAEKDEAEVRQAFERARTVRELGEEAREVADQFFYETLVRLHRASEGEGFTGLKPVGTTVDAALRLSDQALESGDASIVVEPITEHVREGLAERFEKAVEAKAHAMHSTEAGREFVAAYVELVHYAKAIHEMASGHGVHGAHNTGAGHADHGGHGGNHSMSSASDAAAESHHMAMHAE